MTKTKLLTGVAAVGLMVSNLLILLPYPVLAVDEWNTATYSVDADGYTITYDSKSYTVASSNKPGNYYWGNNYPTTDTANGGDNDSVGIGFDDIWGGGSDMAENGFNSGLNPARQGPCDNGWHVPSRGEWRDIMVGWCRLEDNSCTPDDIGYNPDAEYESIYIGDEGLISAFKEAFNMEYGYYWSSSADSSYYARGGYIYDGDGVDLDDSSYPRSYGNYVRCFKDPPVYIEPTDSNTQVTVGQTEYSYNELTMTVTTNTVQQAEGKQVLGEVSVNFGSNESAKFSKLVKINIPVEDAEQVIIKVKHAGSSEYNFDGLTTNINASCNNGRPTSSQYNGETITVVNGYASIYTCEASDFVALGVENGGDSLITVNIAEFNGGQNTCSGSNYIFENIVAGTNTGTHTLSGVFQCAFGNGRSSSTVTLQLSGNLVADGDRVISGSNLMMKNSEWTVSPVGLKFANTLIDTWRALTATQTLFQKTANLIGVASGVVEVHLTVPGGTPDGTYNGTLVLTY